MKTLPPEALAQQFNASQKGVWLVEIDADAPESGVTTLYYASRAFTLSGQAYVDALLDIEFGWQRVRRRGGHAAVAQATITFANLEKLSALTDTFYLENDECRIYWCPVTGSEATSDRVLVQRGVIDNYPVNMLDWTLTVVDASDKDFREIPANIISLGSHVDAPQDSLGEPLPFVFGNLNNGPAEGDGTSPTMAKCRCTDIFGQEYQSAVNAHTYNEVYQYYSQASRSALIPAGSMTQSGDSFTVDDPSRVMEIRPARPKSTNDVATWKLIADGDNANGYTMTSGDDLDVHFGGMPKVGSLTAIEVLIYANGGNYDWAVYHKAVLLDSGTDSGDLPIDLAGDIATYWTDDWDFENLSIEIDYNAACEIEEVVLNLTYDDQTSGDRIALDLHQKVLGYKDDTARYNSDGASNPVIADGSSMLIKPADLLEAILRDKDLMNLSVAEVDLASFDTARSAMSGVSFAFQLYATTALGWIDELCFQSGMHLFKSFAGKWKVVYQDKTRSPTSTFLHEWNIAVSGVAADKRDIEYLFRLDRTPTRQVLNELALRHSLDRQANLYGVLEVASGRFRVDGTATETITATSTVITLTDSAADFVNDGVLVGDTIYVQTDQDYTLKTVAATVITAETAGVAAESASGTPYWVGPNVDGRMIRSQNRYKTENALGRAQTSFTVEGGYPTDLINDAATAVIEQDRLIEWNATRRLRANLTTGMNALDLELGDAVYLDHPWLPTGRRPIARGTLSVECTSGHTTITLQAGEGATWRDDDQLLVNAEVMQVTSIFEDILTVSRAKAGTVKPSSHAVDSVVSLLIHKWEVTGIHPLVGDFDVPPSFELELQEMPRDYTHEGVCVADGWPDGTSATGAELLSSGWCVYNSSRLFEFVEDSDFSYVGA